jgi:hypothetical protein
MEDIKMSKLYEEIGKLLDATLESFNEGEENISTSLKLTVTDGISESLVYELSFIYLHDSICLFGSCSGGGFGFLEEVNDWIGIDSIDESLAQVVKSNLDKMDLQVLSIELEA